ncbi:MAG: NADH-quinone oxidoreductase subunit M, partial [Actinobacteria bacterium]|nr:NADH-quinone oxidoreductase subunit M [Actinomycetota bacterium]
LAHFVGEFQVFTGTFDVYPWLAGIALLGIVVTAALFLRMLQQVLLGKLPGEWSGWADLRAGESAGLAPLLALTVIVGVVPAWLLTVIDATAGALVGR